MQFYKKLSSMVLSDAIAEVRDKVRQAPRKPVIFLTFIKAFITMTKNYLFNLFTSDYVWVKKSILFSENEQSECWPSEDDRIMAAAHTT